MIVKHYYLVFRDLALVELQERRSLREDFGAKGNHAGP